MDLADEGNSTSVVCEKRDATLQRTSTKTPFFLSANSVAYLMCRSGKSPVSVYDYTVSIFASVG